LQLILDTIHISVEDYQDALISTGKASHRLILNTTHISVEGDHDALILMPLEETAIDLSESWLQRIDW